MRTGRWRLAGALVLWLAITAQAAAQSPDDYGARLDLVRQLIRADLLELAERRLLTEPPPSWHPAHDIWQLRLAELYRSQGAWHKLLEQLQPSTTELLPSGPLFELAELHIAEAHSALGNPAAARAVLRRALLDPDRSGEHRRRLRQRLIGIYLAEDALPDLELAMQQFQNDYRPQDAEWRLLQARIQLRLDRPRHAVNLLAALATPQARLLGLYARLRSGELSAEALQAPLAELRGKVPAGFTRPILAVEIAALQRSAEPAEAIKPLETYLGSPVLPNEPAGLPTYDRSDLRRLYIDFAVAAANRAGLLVGEEQNWLKHARSLPVDALERRAWLAYLWLESDKGGVRRLAFDEFVATQLAADNIALLVHLLDAESGWEHPTLSPLTGLALSNAALAGGYYTLAATALTGLNVPPGLTATDWTLHAARVELLAGRDAASRARLHAWLDGVAALEPEVFDRALQLVFDLQRLEKHDEALVLIDRLTPFASTAEQRRQIPYWMAESHAARGEHLIAAEQFLISALSDAGGYDLWGQAARHQAAEVLIRAELYADARRLLQGLLVVSDTPQRSKRLQQRLQSLQVLEMAAEQATEAVPAPEPAPEPEPE